MALADFAYDFEDDDLLLDFAFIGMLLSESLLLSIAPT